MLWKGKAQQNAAGALLRKPGDLNFHRLKADAGQEIKDQKNAPDNNAEGNQHGKPGGWKKVVGRKLALDVAVPQVGQGRHYGTKGHHRYPNDGRVTLARNNRLLTQGQGDLPDEQRKFDNDKTESHQGDAGSDPGKKSAFIRQVICGSCGFRALFCFFHEFIDNLLQTYYLDP